MDNILTTERLKGPPFANPLPHVVMLGAGASKAACHSGDRNGKLIPLMNELPEILGSPWKNLVEQACPPDDNFEAQFSWIRRTEKFSQELLRIQKLIEDYFEVLDLPDYPTIYDYLVLGLRAKDVIATFNWDPLLLLAHKRNRTVADLPDIRFLHGCVAFATCVEHDVLGSPLEICPVCDTPLTRSRLLFPDRDKDYTSDAVIHRDWGIVTEKLKKAFHLTIFGYCGPETDHNARKLILEGWTQTPRRPLSHVEVIDIKEAGELLTRWAEFIPFHHSMINQDFSCSTIAKWPRRTAEWKESASLHGIPAEYLGPFHTDSLQELQDWFSELAETEPNIT